MQELTPHQCRVLGVLVEKALTTPAQYPLTLNALVSGANQKSNRLPVMTLDEDEALTALDGLRVRGLAREVMLTGSRVEKHRQTAREALNVTTTELVVLTELMLRGPQTVGELRGRASRMHPLESLDVVNAILDGLMKRDEPLVVELPPPPGSRARLYGHLLCGAPKVPRAADPPAAEPAPAGLESRVAALEDEVSRLRDALRAAGVLED